jgi:hypothetical protein
MTGRPVLAPGQESDESCHPDGRPGAAQPQARLSVQLGLMVVNIGASIALYYLLRAVGVSSLLALTAGAVISAVSTAWRFVVQRRLDPFNSLVVVTIGLSILAAVIAHSPRFLLARDGLITGVWGVWFVASAVAGQPAAFVLGRVFLEGRSAFTAGSWDALWANNPAFRRIWRAASVIWGCGMLADAVARVVMSYTLPINTVPALGGLLWPVTFVLIQIVTNVYYHRAGLWQILGARWLRWGQAG